MVEMYHLEVTQKEIFFRLGNFGINYSTIIENVCLVEKLKHNLALVNRVIKVIELFLINQNVSLKMHVMVRFFLLV